MLTVLLERDLNIGKNPHEDKVGAGGQSKLSQRPTSGGGGTFTKPVGGGLRRLVLQGFDFVRRYHRADDQQAYVLNASRE